MGYRVNKLIFGITGTEERIHGLSSCFFYQIFPKLYRKMKFGEYIA
jgi:hypothetical protein